MSTLHIHIKRIARLMLSLLLPLIMSVAVAQDHANHDHALHEESHDHAMPTSSGSHAQHNADSADAQSMPMQMGEQSIPQAVRDPHAYSGGYSRSEGPYSLPPSEQLRLADEERFMGVWVDRLETRNGRAEDFQEFQGQVWIGNSYRRFILRTELEGREQTLEESKTELLYSRAVAPFWNLEVGGRYDHGDKDHREWFGLGISGLAPHWIEVSATAYVSPEGHSAATVEAEYDLYLSQRVILQPKVELDFYGDSDLEAGHGKGLSKSLMGFRLRYDLDRQFSPYLGYERVHRHGETTTVFEPFGQHRENHWIAGFRFWF